MRPEMKRRLASFVDRVQEMTSFCQMLDKREKLIMTVWGEAGLGKTSLYYRMVHECALRKLRKAEVVWSDTRKHDYLAIMCKIRDDVGVDDFKSFTELVNSPYSAPVEFNLNLGNAGAINIANNMQVEGANIGDIALIKASQIVLPVSDMAAIEKSRMIKLTDLFIQALAPSVEKEPLVIFFDAIEKMSEETYNWVRDELLKSVSGGRLQNVCFVLCGRQKPEFDTDIQWFVEEAQLQPLGLDDISEYLMKRARDEQLEATVEKICGAIANVIFRNTKGRPDEVAYQVEGFIQDCKSEVSQS